MYLHEYQAKDILRPFGIPTPDGDVVSYAKDAYAVAENCTASAYVVKAQVHAGGRGKAGGVRKTDSPAKVQEIAEELLGQKLVTEQTGPDGRTIRRVYIESAIDAAREIFVSMLVDAQSGQIALIGSQEGGEDIEALAAQKSIRLERLLISLDDDPDAIEFKEFAQRLSLEGPQTERAAALFRSMYRAFVELDASLIEINPLAVTTDGELVALDVKMAIDDNALYRHPELEDLRDEDAVDKIELAAQRHDVNYIQMDGNIGVVVNGAGLALATLDLLRDAGGEPANFMDIRTTASSMQIARGFDLLLSNSNVEVVLVNIHGGGMTRCDTIIEGIGISLKRNNKVLPLVIRLAGNNADYARTLLCNYGISFIDSENLADAVERVLALVRMEAA
ncbi:succinate--CoA ligase [ADP-forming] subunit beta [bacterium MnTg02]|nr:succinate--CoA ligase [ADP-forming] subunit beta [bacterium MnTg02]